MQNKSKFLKILIACLIVFGLISIVLSIASFSIAISKVNKKDNFDTNVSNLVDAVGTVNSSQNFCIPCTDGSGNKMSLPDGTSVNCNSLADFLKTPDGIEALKGGLSAIPKGFQVDFNCLGAQALIGRNQPNDGPDLQNLPKNYSCSPYLSYSSPLSPHYQTYMYCSCIQLYSFHYLFPYQKTCVLHLSCYYNTLLQLNYPCVITCDK